MASDTVMSALDRAVLRNELALLNLSDAEEVLKYRLHVAFEDSLCSLSSEVLDSCRPKIDELQCCINCGSIGGMLGLVLVVEDPNSLVV